MGPFQTRRRGFTLIELLVLMAIIGILIALLVPAVQQAREAARRSQCNNNLKQIGVALHNYHSTHSTFPPGYIGNLVGDPTNGKGWAWGAMLLPYLDQAPLYKSLDLNRYTLLDVLATPSKRPLLQTPLAVFRCASDVGDAICHENRGFSGVGSLVPPEETAAYDAPQFSLPADASPAEFGPRLPRTNLAMIGVGTSQQTVTLLSRALLNHPIHGPPPGGGEDPEPAGYWYRSSTSNYLGSFGNAWYPDSGNWTFEELKGTGVFGSNTSVRLRDISDGSSQTFAVGERTWENYAGVWSGADWWNQCDTHGTPMVVGTAYYKINGTPNAYHLSCDSEGSAGFSSMHPGGANFLMCDGSVRFVNDSIDFDNDPSRLGLYQKLGRIDDGQQ